MPEIRFINRETGEIKEQDVVHGRLPAHDAPRHLHHQRHRARCGIPARCVQPRRVLQLPSATRHPTRPSTTRRSSLPAVHGSSLRPTSATSCPCASTASASSLLRCFAPRPRHRRDPRRDHRHPRQLRDGAAHSRPRPRHHQGRVAHRAVQVASVRASPRRSTPLARCSTACSSTRSATTWLRLAVTRSTRSSASILKIDCLHAYAGRHHRNHALHRWPPRRRRGRIRSTTSTTSATAASARSASSSRTSSASAFPVWSALCASA